jgi:signal peptidase I
MTTLLALGAFSWLLSGSALVWAVCFRWGLRWAKVEPKSVARTAVAFASVNTVNAAVVLVYHSPISNADSTGAVFRWTVIAAVLVLATCWCIRLLYRLSLLRAVRAWLPTFAGSVAVVIAFDSLFVPFVVQAYSIPTNCMAPTLLGDHVIGKCDECSQRVYSRNGSYDEKASFPGICDNFHMSYPTRIEEVTRGGDRVIALKFVKPKRWDVVVVRVPDDPERNYFRRLVGLPGEKISIKDGEVYADGEELSPPHSLAGIAYADEVDGWFNAPWATPERPAKLADDEYFVLGDFSVIAWDSRVWFKGVPGHPPYAVPKSHIVGVATHIYWPPSRVRTLRP